MTFTIEELKSKLKPSKKYSRETLYREPWVFKVSNGIEIRYLNERQINDPETEQRIREEKLKLIEMFRNYK